MTHSGTVTGVPGLELELRSPRRQLRADAESGNHFESLRTAQRELLREQVSTETLLELIEDVAVNNVELRKPAEFLGGIVNVDAADFDLELFDNSRLRGIQPQLVERSYFGHPAKLGETDTEGMEEIPIKSTGAGQRFIAAFRCDFSAPVEARLTSLFEPPGDEPPEVPKSRGGRPVG